MLGRISESFQSSCWLLPVTIYSSTQFFSSFFLTTEENQLLSPVWGDTINCLGLILSTEMRRQYQNMAMSGSQRWPLVDVFVLHPHCRVEYWFRLSSVPQNRSTTELSKTSLRLFPVLGYQGCAIKIIWKLIIEMRTCTVTSLLGQRISNIHL